MSRRTTAALVALALVAMAPGAGAVPPGVPYSGYLEDAAGTPYAGTLDLEATLFQAATGGGPAWGPVVLTGVTAVGGRFEVTLDDASSPLGEALSGLTDAYFAFRVRPAGEGAWIALDGRQRLGSAGFAHVADDAERLGGVSAADYLTASEAQGQYAITADLAPVATSGAYDDLSGRPSLAGYALTVDLAGVCFSGSYDDLVDAPDVSVFVTANALAAVATSGAYTDLMSRPDLSVYALTANLALVATTGQYNDLLGRPNLSAYAQVSSLAAVATSGAYADLSGRPDLTPYAVAANLAEVAATGSYADLTARPDLSVYALVATLSDVALSGDYFALANAPDPDALVWRDGRHALTGDLDAAGHALKNVALHPSPTGPPDPVLGQVWFDTGTELLRVFTSGGWQAVGGALVLPADGLDAISNGTLTNVFTAGGTSGDVPVPIPDNFPPGVTATLTIADSGQLRALSIHVAITHPDATELMLVLTAPGGQTFTLHDGTPGTSGGLDATWPPTTLATGDLATLLGASPAGTWTLSVADTVYSGGAPGSVAGEITDFTVDYDILRDGEVAVTGALIVDGTDVAAELAALRAELNALRPVVNDAWCTANCGSETFADRCRGTLCDGIARTCEPGELRSEGALCGDAAGFACTSDGVCANGSGEVRVPPGDFWMGCNSALDDECSPNESAQHQVTLSPYAFDRTEVTALAYKACVVAGGCSPAGSGVNATYNVAGKESHPINYVTWSQASAYCAWSGKAAGQQRLCTEAEWERAARGGCETVVGECRTKMRTYPWGEAAPTAALANFNSNEGATTAVLNYSPAGDSPYGGADMSGNVNEWVSDWYSGSYTAEPAIDPVGAASGTYRILRGGRFNTLGDTLRASSRGMDQPSSSFSFFGFRCCRSLP